MGLLIIERQEICAERAFWTLRFGLFPDYGNRLQNEVTYKK